ncbi:MAG: ABC transporter ATP-binding protein/permease [Muribaculaceae bacterium]|nr:ABC transporter ATP-binding protein/permease [Muribaculaceae bacterium]
MKRILPYIHYLWRITDGFHRTATVITLLGVLRVGVILLFIWLSKSAIDCAVGRMSGGADTLVTLFSMMVVCMISDVLISQWTAYAESRATMRMRNSVNRRLYNALMTMPLVNGQQGFHSGDMLNHLTIDVRTVTTFALSQLPNMVVMLVQLLGAFVFLAWLNPYLALAPIVIMPVCILASKMFFRRQRRLTTRIRQGESDMHVSIQEGLKNRMLLRTLECIDEMDYRLSAIQHKLDSTNKQQTRLSTVSGALVRVGFVLGYLTAFGWSIFSLKVGVITFGTMMAFIQLVNRIQRPIAGISGYIPAFISTSVAIDRLSEIDVNLTTHQPHHPVDNQTCPHLGDAPLGVRVSDMSFRYEADGHDILSSFSHDFTPGSRTMIVGSTGVGKTTLVKLLLGLLRPDAGTIEVYGCSGAASVSSSTLCHFVYVPQGNSLLPGTVRDNLLLASPQATDQQLAQALHIAVADFVFDLPQGLDTSCDEAGGGLSEGQAQRIAIARALLRPGSIMLLDEFNSALDADTAATLMQRLAAHCTNSTIIIIAHHQSAIAPYCDTILPISYN